MKALPQSFSEWFLDWEDMSHPVTALKRAWVLANISADDKHEHELTENRLDKILLFSNPEGFKRWKDPQKTPLEGEVQGEVETEPPSDEFLKASLSLPSRRMRKPPSKDDFIARRMRELSPKSSVDGMKVVAGDSKKPDKPLLFRRAIVIKKKKKRNA